MSDRPPPRWRTPDRPQVLPAIALDDLLDPDHQARVVWDFGRGLALQALADSIRSRQGGPSRAAIDPRRGVARWLDATVAGVGSARALAWRCANPTAFRWLCGGVAVNHHTRSDFRVGHRALLDQLRTHAVAVLRAQGLVDRNRGAHDGMRVRASAGAAAFHRRATREECRHEAADQVARLKAERDDDPSAPSRRHAAARARRPGARRAAAAGPGAVARTGGQAASRREGPGPGRRHRPGGDRPEDG